MTYLRVTWIHNHPNEPIEHLSELDDERYEMRRIERFRDGKVSLLDVNAGDEDMLAENPMPEKDLIELTPALHVLPLSQAEFEQVWHSATVSKAA